MKRIKVLLVGLACCGALAVSATALTLTPQNSNQNSAACCDMANCCKDAAMSCCKKKKNGKNAHACCKGKDGAGESCCCKGDSCPMPNKKTSNTNTN
jgi:hypothetical protein